MDALPLKAPGAALEEALDEARAGYAARNPQSAAMLRRNQAFMPGGNTRSVLFYEPFPLVMARGEGCHLWDADGHRYVDLLGEFTAGLYGHSNPVIRAAILEALEGGLNLGAHNMLEGRLAELVCGRFPSIERVRFTNSGTEANLMALAAAKAFTGRPRILVFTGAYHGGVLTFVSGPSTASVPHDFLLAPYNDEETATRLIRENADSLAAVLVEPMLGSGGCIPGDPAFLSALRAETEAVGALLVLDEVMTSRMSGAGRQAMLGLRPDLTTLGKYIGGGMSFGAFGGRADVMALFDPTRPGGLPHAGTFNNNVLTMAAGAAGLTQVFAPETADALFARGEALRDRLNALCRARAAAMQFTGLGSLMNAHFTAAPIRRPADAASGDARLRDLFFFDMAEAGFYLARRGLVALMLPLGQPELDGFAGAVGQFLERRAALIGQAEASA
ncbi:aminotransferase class III-fold pyridoxal phosphate-dependent enzyme [Roseomonas sp. SSH11]|uniref:Aminotransferase class III-fold pyridoxal phosphate-dependent enzyme n=1 Tax=Pararoseomonas baculiformis TaxID=2820812 RepID=A0ABS4AAS8_9PROT|nr:aminotransferase class III-fold pyridoxal phosphate-dependent enzyme [Pararoseomonas baculiformis]MBP0444105.1 aminotransferase class III-fold pyridoxal phosphate-dependent enzyme [Pararoseomonas baculiformis]